MFRGVLEAQAPPKQNATDTINTFSVRLNSATLLEDRRQAILGLRSFAKEFPASVASGGLRGLIASLSRDTDDVDTGKIVLETLLMLFSPNDDSPEASDDISLWLADEFSQRQDNITVLLDLLEKGDFYTSLYALQLLSAIASARPERTQECILSAPLGTARLVAALDDSREAVRSTGLLLLNDVTQSSFEIQKIVAFENAFDRIFNLIRAEGSLTHGGIVVQDCLTLLANLVHLNASNQSLFRETGFVPRLAALMQDDETPDGEADPTETRDKNLWGVLTVVRMFLIKGSTGTQANQLAFQKHGILQLVLNLGFSQTVGAPIRAEALRACADIIRGNAKLQEPFAFNVVPLSPPHAVNGDSKPQTNGITQTYVIDALLDLALSSPTISLFDVRFAACECIQAYFHGFDAIRRHFLRRAIDGYAAGEDETSNLLSILMGGPRAYQWADPYRIWFAALIAFHLVFEDPEAKSQLMNVSEGDESKGEEVVSSIQVMAGNLISALQDGEDERIPVGYAILLCAWLSDESGAVNDLLNEGSAVQSLMRIVSKDSKEIELSQGMCTMLLGVLYEFSTKDSPIPRRKLQPLLINAVGREHYVQRIANLRKNPILRDFEVLPQDLTSAPPGLLPEVYFDQLSTDFLKDNFRRLTRAIDRDPGLEVVRQQEGVDRDLVDSLRSQISDKNEALQKAELEVTDLDRKVGQEQADHRRSQETSSAELNRIKSINEALQKGHDNEMERIESGHRTEMQNLRDQHSRSSRSAEVEAQKIRDEAARQSKASEEQLRSQIDTLERKRADLETRMKQAKEAIETFRHDKESSEQTVSQRDSQIESLKDAKQVLEESIELNTVNVRKLEDQIKDYEAKLKESREKESSLQAEVEVKEEARSAAQTELDDLLIVLGDLEDKRARDKKRIKELGGEISDANEDDEEGDNDDDDDDDDDDGEGGEEEKGGKGEDKSDVEETNKGEDEEEEGDKGDEEVDEDEDEEEDEKKDDTNKTNDTNPDDDVD